MDVKKNLKKLFNVAKHEIHRHPAYKFLIVLLIVIIYLFVSIKKFGTTEGFLVSILTWSFFVLCTPVADAGFLLDLPVRIFTGIRMVYSEMIVWIIAIATNILALVFHPAAYSDTLLLSLFYHILTQPLPYIIIILLSGVGTFLSIVFGDELLDISYEKKDNKEHHKKHRHKHHLIVLIFLFVLIMIIYDFLLNSMGIHIPLF